MSNPRHEIRRKLQYAIRDVENIQEHLMLIGEVYALDHPEIVEQYKVVYAYFEQGKALLAGLHDEY